jgi:hypothetical protein
MPEEEPQEGFTVRDRRRFLMEEDEGDTSSQASAPAPAAPDAPAAASAGTAAVEQNAYADAMQGMDEEMGEMGGDASLPDVYSVLALFLGELRNLAWLRMGLVANPATGQVERDLSQAKIAIDTVAFLAQQLESVVAPEERLPLRALVSDLQVNFVEQTKRG